MVRSRILLVSLSTFLLVTLVSCGKDGVCFLGMGSCSAYSNQPQSPSTHTSNSGNPPSGKLAIGCRSWGQCWTYSEVPLQLYVVGATGTYTIEVHDNFAGENPVNNQFVYKTNRPVKTKLRVLDTVITNKTMACDLCDVEVTILPNPATP